MLATSSETTDSIVQTVLDGLQPEAALYVNACVQVVRERLPRCEFTDAELAELIAVCAVARGFQVVVFDHRASSRQIERAVY